VTRVVDLPPQPDAGAGPSYWPRDPAFDPAAGVLDVEEPTRHYAVRPVRPVAQLAARVGLWGAVGFGCLGGFVGLVRPAPAADLPAVVETDTAAVPSPVTGVAELVVTRWLTATEEDQDRLDALFVDGVTVDDGGAQGLIVGDVTAVAGRRIEEGYWAVTVAAEVTEPAAPQAADTDAAGNAEAPTTTWFVEVGIVGDADGGLAALTTPAVLPAPPTVSDGWQRDDAGAWTPDEDDPVVATIEGFLTALLTGEGDPSRYLAPGGSIVPADPPPFTELVVMQMAAVGNSDDTEVRAWTQVQVTTPGGARRVVAYEVVIARRVDRWEVVELSGVPTRVDRPADTDPAPPVPSGDGSSDNGASEDGSVEGEQGGTGSGGTDETTSDSSTGGSTTTGPATTATTDRRSPDGTTAD
jgi:hypothetical protein